jgi:hypothetical protein
MADEQRDRYGGYPGLQAEATGFFRLERLKGRWWLIDPQGSVFLSLGINHFDASALKYADNIHIWRERYGSNEAWIRHAGQDLQRWGFNALAWSQELATRKDYRHTPEWRAWRFRWAGVPYYHHLPFAPIERWNPYARYPDVFSRAFEERCDFLARYSCVDMADDPYLIGYEYVPMPGWTHHDYVQPWGGQYDWRAPEDAEALYRLAERYYQVTHDAIRRYDQQHLIIGDQLEHGKPLPDWLVEAMKPYTDVIAFNGFAPFEAIADEIQSAHERTGKPVLLADSAFLAPTELLHVSPQSRVYCADQAVRGQAYQRFARRAFAKPYVIGWHWCAYIENRARCSGVRNYLDEPYHDLVSAMRDFNHRAYAFALRSSDDGR